MPDLPLFLSEWNVQGMMDARDSTFAVSATGEHIAAVRRACEYDAVLNLLRRV
jgi:hypothetical protein